MARSIVGVIIGFLVVFVTVMLSFTAAYLLMGADRAFKPGTYELSTLWIVVAYLLAALGAILGGVVCRLIGRSMTPVYVFAAIVLMLGVAMAIPVLLAEPTAPPVRTGEVPNLEAMSRAPKPKAAAIADPFVGAAGVVVGGLLIHRRRARSSIA